MPAAPGPDDVAAPGRGAEERPLRIGLSGCGRLGAGYYIPAIAAAAGVELVAIAEPDLGRSLDARELAWRLHGPGVRVSPTAGAMIGSGALDAVILAGPPETHVEQAALSAAAGIPALVEKPPADDVAGALALTALDPAPRIGFNRRFSIGAELRRQLRGPLPPGAHLDLELRYLRLRWRPHVTATDALDDVGSHLVDLALWLLAPQTGVELETRTISLRPTAAEAELRTAAGSTTRIRCNATRPWRERAELRDAAGKQLASARLGGVGLPLPGRRGAPDPLTASLIAQLEAFAAAVRGESGGELATASEGARVMRALAAIRASAESRQWTATGAIAPLPAAGGGPR